MNRRNYSLCSAKIDNGQNNSITTNEDGETNQRSSNQRTSNRNNNFSNSNFTFQMNDIGNNINFSSGGNNNFTYQFSTSGNSNNRRVNITTQNPNNSNDIFNIFNFLGSNMNNMFSSGNINMPNDFNSQINNLINNLNNQSYTNNEQVDENNDQIDEETIQRYNQLRKYVVSQMQKHKYSTYIKIKKTNKQE